MGLEWNGPEGKGPERKGCNGRDWSGAEWKGFMSSPWLILDSNYLCWKSFYAMGGLSHEGESTAIAYGFFRDVLRLQELHNTKRIVFAFDLGKPLRIQAYPEYKADRKARRKEMTDGEREVYWDFRQQVAKLRKEYLPAIGFRNVLTQQFFEADDVIASVCLCSLKGSQGIVVSSDHDMFQLLALPNVIMWSPKLNKAVTAESFEREWGIRPDRWRHVKAMAGCSSDNIEGIKGIGEKTAAKWQAGKLKPGTKAFEKILRGNDVYKRNLPLVTLPYEGTKKFRLRKDEVTRKKWREVMDQLGMKSIREMKG